MTRVRVGLTGMGTTDGRMGERKMENGRSKIADDG